MDLNESEILITFIFQYLRKKSHLMIFVNVRLNSVNDSCSPLNNQRFEPILLVQIGVHELLEGFAGHFRILTLFVEFDFLGIHVLDGIFELLKGQNSCQSLAYWHGVRIRSDWLLRIRCLL